MRTTIKVIGFIVASVFIIMAFAAAKHSLLEQGQPAAIMGFSIIPNIVLDLIIFRKYSK